MYYLYGNYNFNSSCSSQFSMQNLTITLFFLASHFIPNGVARENKALTATVSAYLCLHTCSLPPA